VKAVTDAAVKKEEKCAKIAMWGGGMWIRVANLWGNIFGLNQNKNSVACYELNTSTDVTKENYHGFQENGL
jgi:hypothetical protein